MGEVKLEENNSKGNWIITFPIYKERLKNETSLCFVFL